MTDNTDWLAVVRKAAEDTLAAIAVLETVPVVGAEKVELPTEPGFYLNSRQALWTLEHNGQWRNDYDDPESPAAVFNSAPFMKLEPVAETAKKVLDAVENIGHIDGDSQVNLRAGMAQIATEFGVQS